MENQVNKGINQDKLMQSLENKSQDEVKAINAEGGRRSGEVRRARKNIQEMARLIDTMPPTASDAEIVAEIVSAGFEIEHINQQMIRFYRANINSRDNPAFFKELNILSGERPSERTETTLNTGDELNELLKNSLFNNLIGGQKND